MLEKIKQFWAWYIKAVTEPDEREYGTPEEVADQHKAEPPDPWP